MTLRERPVGVFDSGVGGLTVLRELRRHLPCEHTVYLGDEARMPYGPRPADEVIGFTREAVRWFAKQDCKLVVLACNTAAAVALEIVRESADVPVIGVVRPGAAAALSASASRAVGVLATEGTVRSDSYARALRDLDPLVRVRQVACPALVPLVEAGEMRSAAAEAAVRGYVGPLVLQGADAVDTLLLGCTHYPLLREVIERVAGPSVRVVDSAATTALAVREVLASHHLLREAAGDPTHRVFATGPRERFRTVARTIFGEDLPDIEEATLT